MRRSRRTQGTLDARSDSGGGESAVFSEVLYTERRPGGNTFACATCHSLEEPAPDGERRPRHKMGDAAIRPSYKNDRLAGFIFDGAGIHVRSYLGLRGDCNAGFSMS